MKITCVCFFASQMLRRSNDSFTHSTTVVIRRGRMDPFVRCGCVGRAQHLPQRHRWDDSFAWLTKHWTTGFLKWYEPLNKKQVRRSMTSVICLVVGPFNESSPHVLLRQSPYRRWVCFAFGTLSTREHHMLQMFLLFVIIIVRFDWIE